MLSVAEHAVEVAEVVARAVISLTEMLDEEASSLAVLFRFVMLLTVFDESTFAVVCGIVTRLLDQFVGWRSAVTGLQLLA